MNIKLTGLSAIACLLLASGCSDNNTTTGKKEPAPKADTGKKEAPAPAPAAKRPPVMNIVDTLTPKRIVLYMKDSAASMDRIGMKLGDIYGVKLAKFMKDNKVTPTGSPMAWYKGNTAPYFFEAGMPVDKAPGKLSAGIFSRVVPAGSVILVHFYGPYEMMGMAYDEVKARMDKGKIAAAGAPFEIYIGDPEVQKDPYKVQTDIVFPVKGPAK